MKKVFLTVNFWSMFLGAIFTICVLIFSPIILTTLNQSNCPAWISSLLLCFLSIFGYICAKDFVHEFKRRKERTLGIVSWECEVNQMKMRRCYAQAERYKRYFDDLTAEKYTIMETERIDREGTAPVKNTEIATSEA